MLTTDEKEQIGEIPNLSAQLICNIKQNRIIPETTFLSHNNINKIKEGANFIEQELQKLEIQTPLITNERNR